MSRWSAPAAPGTGHLFAGYLSVFLLVMVAVWAIGLVIRQAVRSTSLNGADRMLGGVLGLARGGLIGCVLLLIASYTPLPREAAWHDSNLRAMLSPGVGWMQGTAGIAAYLLRLGRVLRDGRTTPAVARLDTWWNLP